METWREEFYASDYGSEYLMHHGIKGQRWGVRRFQNEDGTLTEAGRRRYEKAAESLTEQAKKYDKLYESSKKQRTGNIEIYDSRKRAKAEAFFKKHQDYFQKTMDELKGTDYSIGYDYVQDKYYMRKVDRKDGVDHWSINTIGG